MKKSSKRKSTRLNAKKGRVSKKVSGSGSAKPGKSKTAQPAQTSGRRVGTKRSDLRFIAEDGSEWASPFEYRVFTALQMAGHVVRRTGPADSLKYTTPVKNGRCTCHNPDFAFARGDECKIVQDRVYTPDLVVDLGVWDTPYPTHARPGRFFYLETKGYFSPQKRNLFRAARQSNPQVDIRLVVSSNHWVTKGKTRLTDWAKRFKIPIHVWDGQLPEDWL